MKVDPQTLATGYRTSKVVGATVVNEVDETVGTIDDLIVTPGGQTPYAVLSASLKPDDLVQALLISTIRAPESVGIGIARCSSMLSASRLGRPRRCNSDAAALEALTGLPPS